MKKHPKYDTDSSKKPFRPEGVNAQQRLLECALKLFAEQGFSKTSTREIARIAEVNISAISYYFGDKANLYRTVFNDPRYNPNIDPAFFAQENLSLEQGIATVMCTFTDSFKNGEYAQHCLKLHIREMLEPTGLWDEEIDMMIQPAHIAFVKFLAKKLNVAKPDDDLHRLAFSIFGLALSLMCSGDVMLKVRPNLISKPKAIDVYAARLVEYALAMCEAERIRRT